MCDYIFGNEVRRKITLLLVRSIFKASAVVDLVPHSPIVNMVVSVQLCLFHM